MVFVNALFVYLLSHLQLFCQAMNYTARQAPLSMGFPSQEYWSEFAFLTPGEFPDQGIEPGSPTLQADSFLFEPPGKPIKCEKVH